MAKFTDPTIRVTKLTDSHVIPTEIPGGPPGGVAISTISDLIVAKVVAQFQAQLDAMQAQITALSSGTVPVIPSVTLPAITASPASPTFVVGTAAGALVVTLSAVPSGATRTYTGDSRLAFNSDKSALVVGATATTAATTLAGNVVDTLAGASNSPVSKAISVSVTAAAQAVTLPAITFSPASPTFVAGTAAGTVVVNLSSVPSGAARALSGDGRLVLNAAKTALVIGATASTSGSTISVTVTDTLSGATNSPLSQAISVSVMAAPATFALDDITDTWVAVSHMRLRKTYTGAAMQWARADGATREVAPSDDMKGTAADKNWFETGGTSTLVIGGTTYTKSGVRVTKGYPQAAGACGWDVAYANAPMLVRGPDGQYGCYSDNDNCLVTFTPGGIAPNALEAMLMTFMTTIPSNVGEFGTILSMAPADTYWDDVEKDANTVDAMRFFSTTNNPNQMFVTRNQGYSIEKSYSFDYATPLVIQYTHTQDKDPWVLRLNGTTTAFSPLYRDTNVGDAGPSQNCTLFMFGNPSGKQTRVIFWGLFATKYGRQKANLAETWGAIGAKALGLTTPDTTGASIAGGGTSGGGTAPTQPTTPTVPAEDTYSDYQALTADTYPASPPAGSFSIPVKVVGVGAPAGTVNTRGMLFQPGELAPNQSAVVKRADGTVLSTQLDHVGGYHPDGTKRLAMLHYKDPGLASGVTEIFTITQAAAPSGSALTFPTSGRSAKVQMTDWNGANPFEFDLFAALASVSTRWFNGPNAVEAQLIIQVPRATLGGATDGELAVNFRYTADGVLHAEVHFRNHYAFRANQGLAEFSLKLIGDGVTLIDRPKNRIVLYGTFSEAVRWSAGGVAAPSTMGWASNSTQLAKCGFTPAVVQSATLDSSVVSGLGARVAAASWNTSPQTRDRDLPSQWDVSGDHPYIAEVNAAQVAWLVTGDKRAEAYCVGQAEYACQIEFHEWDSRFNRFVNNIDRPWARIGTQYGVDDNGDPYVRSSNPDGGYIVHDSAHMPHFTAFAYLMTGRRSFLYSAEGWAIAQIMEGNASDRGIPTAGDAFTTAGQQARYVSLKNDGVGSNYAFYNQMRGTAWTTKTLKDAAIITDGGSQLWAPGYLRAIVEGQILLMCKDRYLVDAKSGELTGVPRFWVYAPDANLAGWQLDMLAANICQIVQAGFANAGNLLAWMDSFVSGRFASNDKGFNPADGCQYNLHIREGDGFSTYKNKWADLKGVVGGSDNTVVTFGVNFANTGTDTGTDYPIRAKTTNRQMLDALTKAGRDTTKAVAARAFIDGWPAAKTQTRLVDVNGDPTAKGYGPRYLIGRIGEGF